MLSRQSICRAAAIAASFALLPQGTAAQAQSRTFEVTIENLTTGQPFSPGVIVTHDKRATLFKLGTRPSAGIIGIAEDGEPATALAELPGMAGIYAVISTEAPIHRMGGPGPSSATFMINAPQGATHISLAVMLICSNDGFTGIDSMPLPSNEVVRYGNAYDAGSEINDVMSESIVDPCGEIGPVAFPADGNNDALPEDGGRVTGFGAIRLKGDLTAAHRWQGRVSRITIRPVSGAMSFRKVN